MIEGNASDAGQGQSQSYESHGEVGQGEAQTENEASASTETSGGSRAHGDTDNTIAHAEARAELKRDLAGAKTESQKQEALKKFKWKMKVDGEESEMELDEDSARKLAQQGLAAQKRMSEAARVKKHAEQIAQLIKADPVKVLKAYGHNVDELAIAHVKQLMDLENMSPVERENMELKRRVQEAEAKEKEEIETRAKKQEEELREQYRGNLQKDIISSLDTPEGRILPRTEETVQRIAKHMYFAKKMGYKNVTPADVLSTVHNSYIKEFSSYARSSTPEQILKWIGPETMKKLREYELSKLQDPSKAPAFQKPQASSQSSPSSATPKSKSKWKTKEEWQAELDKRTGVTR